jgi:SAM-dependent methyltransferase
MFGVNMKFKTINFNNSSVKKDENSKKIKNLWQEGPISLSDMKFLQWFDNHKSQKAYWSSGFIDLSLRILEKDVLREIHDPSSKKCLEIGFGGGRLLNAATYLFDHAYGVDIHKHFDRTRSFLSNKNYDLCLPSNMEEVIKDNSIDLVYSFIVLQHLDSIDTFLFYANQIKRVLKPGGIMNIYYGINKLSNEDHVTLGYEEVGDRGSSLFIHPEFVENVFSKKLGMKVIKHQIAPKQPWLDPQTNPSNAQAFIICKKQCGQ